MEDPGGFIYTWDGHQDLVAGTDYFYWLEAVDVSGATTMHGPVSVSYVGPTAVTLNEVNAGAIAGTALPLAGTLLALLLALAGVTAVQLRRSLKTL